MYCAAADCDGLKKRLKEQCFIHLLFNATLAICGVQEPLPVDAAPGQMGRSARWIRCHINSPLPSKAKRRNNTNSVLWWVRRHCQKQQFILFSLFRHLRHRFRCYLSLVLQSSRNKQKALTGPHERQTSDCRCAALFLLAAGTETLIKISL